MGCLQSRNDSTFWKCQLKSNLYKTKAALVDTLYRKSFLLSNKARQTSTIGEMVNLQSIDAQRIQDYFIFYHLYWTMPLQIIGTQYGDSTPNSTIFTVSTALLWRLIGPSVIVGMGIMLIMIPANSLLGRKLLKLTQNIMKLRDQRTKLMSEFVFGIRVIKFFAWEGSFVDKIINVRPRTCCKFTTLR
jgi:hypothetical protein